MIEYVNGATLAVDFMVWDNTTQTIPHSFVGYTVSLRYGNTQRTVYTGTGLVVTLGKVALRLNAVETLNLPSDGWVQLIATSNVNPADVQQIIDENLKSIGRVR